MMLTRLIGGVLGVAFAAMPAGAQHWRLRLDARAELAAFRGVELDSVLAASVIAGPTGGPVSPDGIIARCSPENPFCYIFRRGARQRGGPAVASADLTLWGLGVAGLRARVHTRTGVDLGDTEAWPGVDPAVQLVEGYAEYAASGVTGRLGRQLLGTRLGWAGFDGGRVIGRVDRLGLEGEAYGGLGLGYATALPVTSPALNPLDEFQPRRRQLVVGAAVAWRGRGADLRLDYQREVDRQTRHFWSERLALSAGWRVADRWSVAGGAEYDLAAGWFGTSDLSARYTGRVATGTLGIRQYRPFFPLWTIWGAFSPVPYHAVHGSVWITPRRPLRLRVSTERFGYGDAEALTPLAQVDDDGWRTSLGATYTIGERWTLDAGYRLEYGPGASVDGWDGRVGFAPSAAIRLTGYAAILSRPLEFRFSESDLSVLGLDAEWQANERLRFSAGGAQYHEDRERPDAASFAWNQVRLHLGIRWMLASDPDPTPLPPAVRRRAIDEVAP